MSGINDYIEEYGQISFEDREFTTEDGLVLSEFAYLKFDGVVGGMREKPVALKEIVADEELKEKLFVIAGENKDMRTFFDLIVNSERFGKMKLACYINQIGAEFQFSSITFLLPHGITFLAFRGTDETMVGWQEDIAMALKHPVKGQLLSAQYVNEVASRISGPFMVGGHSKGGNLAMYGAMYARADIRQRITKVYSFDGPGFRPENVSNAGLDEISDRVVKVIPRSSPVGLIFNNSQVTVVESRAIGMMQHNPFTWVFKNGKLVETVLTEKHKLATQALNEWLLSLDDENLELFVTYLCWTLDATNADTTVQFKNDFSKYFKYLYKASNEVGENEKDKARELMKSFVNLTGELFKQEAKDKYEAIFSDVVRKITSKNV